jgi:hypothetical protein
MVYGPPRGVFSGRVTRLQNLWRAADPRPPGSGLLQSVEADDAGRVRCRVETNDPRRRFWRLTGFPAWEASSGRRARV